MTDESDGLSVISFILIISHFTIQWSRNDEYLPYSLKIKHFKLIIVILRLFYYFT